MSKKQIQSTKNFVKGLPKKKIAITAGTAVVIVLVFFLGLYIGGGQIRFGINGIVSIGGENANLPRSLNYGLIQQEYNIIKQNFDGKLSINKLQDGTMSGLASSTGDPYTEYFNAAEAKQLNNILDDTFSGVGASLGTNSSGQIEVIAPLSGYPAQKAGLKTGDLITSVNGKSTSNMNVDDVVNEIRGPAGTSVTLGVTRDSQQLTFTIKREVITYPSVSSKILSGNIGYIQITSFSSDTSQLAQNAANSFVKAGVKGVILDLRGNPGGLVDAAVSVSSLWLPQGKTIMVEKHDGQVVQTYTSTGTYTLGGIPTVVLIDGGSASASEITAGALHDNNAAKLIGQKSFGKGSVQQIFDLPGAAELKVTIAHWFTPDGKSINGVGIQPDITVVPTTADQNNGVDDQLNSAISYIQSH